MLARSLVELYYGVDDALKAEKHFDQVVVNKNIPDNIPEYKLVGKVSIVDAIFSSKVVESKSEVRRLIKQGAVSIDGNKLDDVNFMLDSKSNQVVKIGKRRFLKINEKISYFISGDIIFLPILAQKRQKPSWLFILSLIN